MTTQVFIFRDRLSKDIFKIAKNFQKDEKVFPAKMIAKDSNYSIKRVLPIDNIIVSFIHFLCIKQTDINECSTKSLNNCQHICLNNMGSYTCACNKGYQLLADKKKCQGLYIYFTNLTNEKKIKIEM